MTNKHISQFLERLKGSRLAKCINLLYDKESGPARFIGGSVRDLLLGIEPNDIDIATGLTPDEVISALKEEFPNVHEKAQSKKHGTLFLVVKEPGVKGSAPHKFEVEVTTLRADLACDGRHAEVAFTKNWKTDAERRDFTINAMSFGLDGEVHDYFTGKEDLKAGAVRFVGDPKERIIEDYLRILRFFRFSARFANKIDPEGLKACNEIFDDQTHKVNIYADVTNSHEISEADLKGKSSQEKAMAKLTQDKYIPQRIKVHPERIQGELFSLLAVKKNIFHIFKAMRKSEKESDLLGFIGLRDTGTLDFFEELERVLEKEVFNNEGVTVGTSTEISTRGIILSRLFVLFVFQFSGFIYNLSNFIKTFHVAKHWEISLVAMYNIYIQIVNYSELTNINNELKNMKGESYIEEKYSSNGIFKGLLSYVKDRQVLNLNIEEFKKLSETINQKIINRDNDNFIKNLKQLMIDLPLTIKNLQDSSSGQKKHSNNQYHIFPQINLCILKIKKCAHNNSPDNIRELFSTPYLVNYLTTDNTKPRKLTILQFYQELVYESMRLYSGLNCERYLIQKYVDDKELYKLKLKDPGADKEIETDNFINEIIQPFLYVMLTAQEINSEGRDNLLDSIKLYKFKEFTITGGDLMKQFSWLKGADISTLTNWLKSFWIITSCQFTKEDFILEMQKGISPDDEEKLKYFIQISKQ